MPPGHWLGLYVLERLYAAIGVTICHDMTLFVHELLCEPSRAGVAARRILAINTRNTWKNGPIRFYCEVDNRSVRRMVEAIGSRPVGVLYENAGGS